MPAPLSVEELAARDPGGPLCSCWAWRAARLPLCHCLVCDPALEGSCPVGPEGAPTKAAERCGGRRQQGPGAEQAVLGLSWGP